jgi:hypothetical protein
MKIEKVRPWCAELDQGLSETLRRDRQSLMDGVNGGWLEAYRLWDGQAYMVTRVERGTLTCCCYQGSRVVDAMRWMRARALKLGLTDIVFFTQRPALAKLLKEFNFELDDFVFRARVAA